MAFDFGPNNNPGVYYWRGGVLPKFFDCLLWSDPCSAELALWLVISRDNFKVQCLQPSYPLTPGLRVNVRFLILKQKSCTTIGGEPQAQQKGSLLITL